MDESNPLIHLVFHMSGSLVAPGLVELGPPKFLHSQRALHRDIDMDRSPGTA